ncbi:hypothetical protein RUM43_001609 [Polyplax serrata]|uniref:Uncharacterized protein n=1 Tax=Polyplax serrata TaxID=468196 RepID=A0AAN8SE60_POLSC
MSRKDASVIIGDFYPCTTTFRHIVCKTNSSAHRFLVPGDCLRKEITGACTPLGSASKISIIFYGMSGPRKLCHFGGCPLSYSQQKVHSGCTSRTQLSNFGGVL